MASTNLIFIGIKGSVLAFNKATGKRAWIRELEGRDYVSLLVEGDLIFASTRGEIFCLNKASGVILWKDGLSGYGYGPASLASDSGSSDSTIAAAEIRQRAQQAAITAASSH